MHWTSYWIHFRIVRKLISTLLRCQSFANLMANQLIEMMTFESVNMRIINEMCVCVGDHGLKFTSETTTAISSRQLLQLFCKKICISKDTARVPMTAFGVWVWNRHYWYQNQHFSSWINIQTMNRKKINKISRQMVNVFMQIILAQKSHSGQGSRKCCMTKCRPIFCHLNMAKTMRVIHFNWSGSNKLRSSFHSLCVLPRPTDLLHWIKR